MAERIPRITELELWIKKNSSSLQFMIAFPGTCGDLQYNARFKKVRQ